jgi:hypothetical protein
MRRGFAWDNGEIGTDLWLWMAFMRTGRSDVWRMAYAMTRHLSEVDFHHTGPFAGLGSRHNVNHWGDGAKEARVAGSTLKRPFYYLTGKYLLCRDNDDIHANKLKPTSWWAISWISPCKLEKL